MKRWLCWLLLAVGVVFLLWIPHRPVSPHLHRQAVGDRLKEGEEREKDAPENANHRSGPIVSGRALYRIALGQESFRCITD